MRTLRSSGRGVVRWILVVAMLLSVLGASLSLVGGVDGDVRRAGLWIVIVGGLGALLVLLVAPHVVWRKDRD